MGSRRRTVTLRTKEAVVATFKHFGVPTQTVQENETYIEGAKVYVTDPDANAYKIEFVRCEAGCPMPEIIQTKPSMLCISTSGK